MNVTLFHNVAGWAVGILALYAVADILWDILSWVFSRLTFGWRHLKIARRWDRPFAPVLMPDGTTGRIAEIFEGPDDAGRIAAIWRDDEGPVAWVPADQLYPVPRHAVTSAEDA
jgi:hypothetical protein